MQNKLEELIILKEEEFKQTNDINNEFIELMIEIDKNESFLKIKKCCCPRVNMFKMWIIYDLYPKVKKTFIFRALKKVYKIFKKVCKKLKRLYK